MIKYGHRFPTPEFIGGGTEKVVAGLFSMEDLQRGIVEFYHFVSRRKQGDWIGKVPEDDGLLPEFPGYHGPNVGATGAAAQDPEDGDRVETSTGVSQPGRNCVVQ